MLSTKWPLAAFLAEIACHMESRRVCFEMACHRDQIAAADAITNGAVHWLAPDKRIEMDISKVPFVMFPKLLDKEEEFYSNLDVAYADEPEDLPAQKSR